LDSVLTGLEVATLHLGAFGFDIGVHFLFGWEVEATGEDFGCPTALKCVSTLDIGEKSYLNLRNRRDTADRLDQPDHGQIRVFRRENEFIQVHLVILEIC